MPLALVSLLMLAFGTQAPTVAKQSITVVGHAGPPFISPMGEPFRSRGPGDDMLADWFYQADSNRDGFLTVDEMQADASRFFRELDTDHNGEIDPEELVRYEWQVAPEIQVSSRFRRSRGSRPASDRDRSRENGRRERDPGPVTDTGEVLEGGARYTLLNIPEPVAAADADFNRGISLAEFRHAAAERFQLLDTAHRGALSLAQFEALRPVITADGHRRKRPDDAPDDRVGLPVPPGP